MPKKKKAAAKVVKKVVKKAAQVAKKPAKKTKQAIPTKRSHARPKSVANPSAVKPVIAVKLEPSLGRPLVTQEEKLYMLFHDDYQSRQVFEFLRVDTIKDLEE